jgi:hypothetical protein
MQSSGFWVDSICPVWACYVAGHIKFCGDERYVALTLIGDLAKRILQKSTT